MTMRALHSDQELLVRLSQDDRSAFEALYYRYAPSLLAYVKNTIYDSEEYQEIIQDIFESLWKRRAELKVESLKTYLFKTARYRMIRHFRRSRMQKEYAQHFTLFESAYDSMPAEESNLEAVREKLLKAIEGLTDRCRMALKLRLDENLSNTEIAERMNITKGTVELYMVKAVQHLRAEFNIGNSR